MFLETLLVMTILYILYRVFRTYFLVLNIAYVRFT